jgi:ABC-2 type transport system permease protein
MLTDIGVVLRKELREIVFPDGRFQGGARNIFIIIGIAGVLFPLQAGPDWFRSWLTISTACFPIILVLNYTADAFAGERERHTLETLLASRLDERAILLGKVLAIVIYGWTLVLVCQPLATLAINLAHRGSGFLFYRPAILAAIVVMSLLVALLICAVGVLISLTAPTVRSAGQRMLVPFVAIFALPGLVPYLVQRMHWERQVAQLTPGTVVIFLALVSAVASGTCLVLGIRRFTRERVVLA